MKKIYEFINKPRNIYFSLIIMLTIVTSLVSISFSYYIDESANDTKLVSLSKVDNRIQSDELENGKILVPAKECLEIDLYVISNNNFDSSYKLYYESENKNINVYSLSSLIDVIGKKDVHKVTLSIENNEDIPVLVNIGIASGYVNTDITFEGNLITQK